MKSNSPLNQSLNPRNPNHGNELLFLSQAPLPIAPAAKIDYKDVELLRKYITERGKILPRRITGLTAKQQRALTTAIKQARVVALLPFINKEG